METDASCMTVPTQKLPRIIRIIFDGDNGYVVFNNGIPQAFEESSLSLLQGYKCNNKVELRSLFASQAFMGKLKNEKSIWKDILMDASTINVYGQWDAKFLAFILSGTPKTIILSLTHWQCDNPAMVLNSLNSNGIRELAIHVQHGEHMLVVDALERWAPRTKLDRLVLVFDIAFKRDIISLFQKRISEVLASGAQVTLLFDAEEDCIQSLKASGYSLDDQIKMAINKPYEDRSFKEYGIYYVYHKNCHDASWNVGCRKVSQTLSHNDGPKAKPLQFPPCDQMLRCDEVWNGILEKPLYQALIEKKEYDTFEKLDVEESCCKLHELPASVEQSVKKWKISSKIQKLIYNNQITEMLTSNGFYIVLDKMNNETEFFATMRTTPRFEFMCTTSDRRFVVTQNMLEFLSDAYHIEFIGTWFSNVIEEIARCFTTRLYALTMMQIEFHTTRPLIHIFNAMLDDVKRNLPVLHYDARATNDWSVGSVVNAILKQEDAQKNRLMKFEELIIISNKWQCQQGPLFLKCRLDYHVRDCVQRLLLPNGSATTVVIESKTSEDYHDAGFYGRSFPVMVPVAYPYRRDTANELTRLMNGYHQVVRDDVRDDGRHIYIAVPEYPMF